MLRNFVDRSIEINEGENDDEIAYCLVSNRRNDKIIR